MDLAGFHFACMAVGLGMAFGTGVLKSKHSAVKEFGEIKHVLYEDKFGAKEFLEGTYLNVMPNSR